MHDDYDALLADLASRRVSPEKIIHLWSTADNTHKLSLNEKLDRSFYSLLFLAQGVGAQDITGIEIGIVSNCLHRIHGEPAADAICALFAGSSRVISKELPGMNFRGIDVDLSAQGPAPAAHQIIAELCTPYRDSVVAIRRGERWTETLEPVQFQSNAIFGGFRKKGVYLITGGLGDLRFDDRRRASTRVRSPARVLGRTPLVPPQQWKRHLNQPKLTITSNRGSPSSWNSSRWAPKSSTFPAMSVAATR